MEDSQKQKIEADTLKDMSNTGTRQDDDFETRDYESNLSKKIYSLIEKSKKLTVIEIANYFNKEPSRVKGILNKLVNSGDVCKHDSGKSVTYSKSIISHTSISRNKLHKPLTEDDIDLNDPEMRKYLNKKPLPDLPEFTNGNENNCGSDHEDPNDDNETNLVDKTDSEFDLDGFMSEEEGSNS
ncbi:FeoC-like transcriptional regulator [Candidatus Scalindua japonica]|uniref:FeoC-like transcriptional regulator n=1 Tax=Candidatus Scalindua japonica TaxID=1284222 RepID=UPI0013A542BE|nr:FeoC-like transcriptional regulator [Candidatus Scalindua japonica]